MPTGFEKFSKRALEEEPISFAKKPAEGDGKTQEDKQVEKLSRVTRATVRPTVERPTGRRREGAEMKNLVTVTIQLTPETKGKLDEMKFREKRKIWELTEEAINDLYSKLYGKK